MKKNDKAQNKGKCKNLWLLKLRKQADNLKITTGLLSERTKS